jgi:ketosteroid isomerase-like protein
MDLAIVSVSEEDARLRAIAEERVAFVDAIRRGDPRAIADLYADDARLVAPEGSPLQGRVEVAAFWHAGVESGIFAFELEPDDVELATKVAWEVGTYELGLRTDDGRPHVDRGRYLVVYGFDGTRWRRTAEMFRPDPAGSNGHSTEPIAGPPARIRGHPP